MGVDATHYLIFGIDLGYDNVEYDKFEAEICGMPVRRFDIVYDGMSGKYAIAGTIIESGDEQEGFGLTKIDLSEFNDDYRRELAEKISKATGREIKPDDLSFILLTNWS